MINKDSIVTAYDEHLTLVEWLQKVEKALDSAVLTNLGIAKLSDKDNAATYQVTATFADNTTILSDSFTLPSTDIVSAFGNLKTLVNSFDSRIATNRENVNSILDIIDIASEKINADALKNSINGDDDVIVKIDNDEDNEKLGIHLSPELQAKITKNTEDIAKKQDLITSATDLTAKTVTADTFKTDSYLKPATIEPSEGSFTFNQLNGSKIGLTTTAPYSHWRISNGKLSIVWLLEISNDTENTIEIPAIVNWGGSWYELVAASNQVTFPKSVADKLYTSFGGNYIATDTKMTVVKTENGLAVQYPKPIYLDGQICKSGNAIFIRLEHVQMEGVVGKLPAGYKMYARFEFNFIL